VPVVCSVGNRSHLGYPQGYISYPAAYDGLKYKGTLLHVISVGAVDQNLQRTPSSNFLPTDDPHLANHPAPSWPTLMAPGYSVPTTDFEDRHGLSKGCYIKPLNAHWPFGWVPDYAPFGGTSAAAPHVTGVIALMLAKRGGMRQLTVAEIKGILTATAVDITAQQRPDDPQVAVGMTPLLLNAAEALRQVP
jgi:subtilisin family serine protease